MPKASTYAYTSLKSKITKAGNGDDRYTQQELEDMVYDRYETDKITAAEYNELCALLESIF